MAKFNDPWLTQRLRHSAALMAGESKIRAVVIEAMTKYLDTARASVLDLPLPDSSLVAAPEDQQPPNLDLWPGLDLWRTFLATLIFPVLGDLWGERFKAFARSADVSEEPYRVNYLEQVEDRLVLWPASAFEEIRLELLEAFESSETIPQQRDRIARVLNIDARSRELQADINDVERDLESPDLSPEERSDLRAQRRDLYERKDEEDTLWSWQANRIARTEVMGAYNGGSFDGASAWMSASGETLFKQWLATSDSRTRDTHRIADGQIQGMAQPFIVGGFPLMHPGDPVGPPQEVIQCRCTLLVVEEEDAPVLQSEYIEKIAQLPEVVTAAAETGCQCGDDCNCGSMCECDKTDKMQSRLTGPLRDYWVRGEGAAKIRWGTPGDFGRCVRQLREYFPQDTEGLCANLHHEATGSWPGRENGMNIQASDQVKRPETAAACLESPGVGEGNPLPQGWMGVLAPMGVKSGDGRVLAIQEMVRTRNLPLVLMGQERLAPGHEGAVTVGAIDHVWVEGNNIMGRGRFDLGSPHGREAARQLSTGYGRWVSVDLDDAVVEEVMVDGSGEIVPQPATTEEMAGWMAPEGAQVLSLFTDYRIIGATFLPQPAFGEAEIAPVQTLMAAASGDTKLPIADEAHEWDGDTADQRVAEWASNDEGDVDWDRYGRAFFWAAPDAEARSDFKLGFADIIDGELTAVPRGIFAAAAALQGARGGVDIPEDQMSAVRNRVEDYYSRLERPAPWEEGDDMSLTAAGGPLAPPSEWFTQPALDGPTPITITAEGRVFGHLAAWESCHVGYPGSCVKPPHTRTQYSHFHVGSILTAEGEEFSVGKITVGGGHADPRHGVRAAVEHYDDTGAAVAVVRAYEDDYGIAVAGSLTPDVSEKQLATLRRSPLSGDWRSVGGNLELVAALCVNTPGFPVPRVVTASAGERPLSLVAAGAIPTSKLPEPEKSAPTTVDHGEIAREIVKEMGLQLRRKQEIEDLQKKMGADPASRIASAALRIKGKGER